MFHQSADLESYIDNLDRLLNILRSYAIRGEMPSLDVMVELLLSDAGSDPMVDCHWLAVNLALALQRLTLGVPALL